MSLTFARSTIAYYRDVNGAWVQAAINELMDKHYDVHGNRTTRLDPARTFYLPDNTVPITRTVSLPATQFCVWMEGSGSITLTGGTSATVTAGAFHTFVLGATTDVTFTLAGSVTLYQCEGGVGAFSPTNFYATTTVPVTRAQDKLELDISSTFETCTVYMDVTEVGRDSPFDRFWMISNAAGGHRRAGGKQGANGGSIHASISDASNVDQPTPDVGTGFSFDGQKIEARWIIEPTKISTALAIDGGAETTPVSSPTVTTFASWAGSPTRFHIGHLLGTQGKPLSLRGVLVARGIRTLADMRAAIRSTASRNFGTAVTQIAGSGSGSGTQTFNGSGAPVATLMASIAGSATQTFVASGTPTATLGKTGIGAGTQTFVGTGAPTRAITASATGVSVNTILISYASVPVTFSLGTGAAASTVVVPHGLGTTPKVVEVSWNGRTESINGFGQKDLQVGRGFANTVSSIVQRSITFSSQNNVASVTRVSKNTIRNDNIICALTGAGAIDGLAAVQSVDATNVTFVINDQFAASLRIAMRCRGGTGITDVWVGDVIAPTTIPAGGVSNITTPGFTCSNGRAYFEILGTGATAANVIGTDSTHSMGVATSPSQQAVLSGGADSLSDTATVTRRYCNTDEVLSLWNAGVTAPTLRAVFGSWITNGFRLAWSEVSGAAARLPCLVIKGPRFAVLPGDAPGTTGATVSITGVGFTPISGMVFSHNRSVTPADSGSQTVDAGSRGYWDATPSQFCLAWRDEDGVATSVTTSRILYDAVYTKPSLSGGDNGTMSLVSVNSDGVTYSMDTGDFSNSFFVTVFDGTVIVTPANTGTGAPIIRLDAFGVGDGTQTFNASGAPNTSISATAQGVGDATQTFTGTGAPAKQVTGSGNGAGFQQIGGTGAATVSIVATGRGEATNVFDGSPPPRRPKGRRYGVKFVDEPKEPDPPKPPPEPKPVPETAALEALPAAMEALFGPSYDPALWHRIAQFHPAPVVLGEPKEELPPAPADARFMARLLREIDLPMAHSEDPDQFFEHFLRQLGMDD